VKLDAVDKAIVGHLQSDGRIPFSNLGPAVGLSTAAVRQRVLHLIDHGAIRSSPSPTQQRSASPSRHSQASP